MRTKEEITKNKSFLGDKESASSGPTPEQIIKKKRFYIIGAIFLTIGLSLIFIIYRQVKVIIDKPISLSLPTLNLPKSTNNSTVFDLTPIIKSMIKDESKWNITVANNEDVYNLPNNKTHFNNTQINTLISTLSKLPLSTEYSPLFPEGLVIHQEKSSTPQFQQLSLLVSPPHQNLVFILDFQGSDIDFQQIITKLIPALYWQVITLDN